MTIEEAEDYIALLKHELRAVPDSIPDATDEDRERYRDQIEALIARADRRVITVRAKIAAGIRADAPEH